MGFQFASQGAIVTTQLYFDKRRSFASGLTMAGISLGTFIWPPLVRFLIDFYTWRGAYYIIAGVTAQIFVLISLLRPPPSSVNQKDKKKTDNNVGSNDSNVKKQKITLKFEYFIWFLYTMSFIAQCAPHFVPMSYYPMKSKEEGIEKHRIPILVSISGGLGMFARPLAGLITDKFNNRIIVAVFALFFCGAIVITSALVHTFTLLLILAIAVGIGQGK